jgi:targeting protein for Xklp2
VEERLHKWQEEVKKELKEQREAANFKARPVTVLDKQPFQPKPSDKPLSEVSNFELHSDRRAREREEFEQMRKQKEAELEANKRQVKIAVINVG